jgi:hypothetical protein
LIEDENDGAIMQPVIMRPIVDEDEVEHITVLVRELELAEL